MIVLDTSAAIDYLVGRGAGEWVDEQIRADGDLHAPHLVDVEVTGVLRRFVHIGLLGPARARLALDDFVDLDLKRYAHLPFLDRIWELRVNLTASDATFVALAEALAAPLVTTNRRLGRAPTKHVTIVTP